MSELVIPARAIAIVSMQEYQGWGLTIDVFWLLHSK